MAGVFEFDHHRSPAAKTTTGAGIGTAVLLVHGFAQATWKLERKGEAATMLVDEFEPFSKLEQAEIEAEANELMAFLAPDASHDVRFVHP